MAGNSLPASIIDISEKAFWRALRAPEHALDSAIAYGDAGMTADAYTALAEYHRMALADMWSEQLRTWETAGPVNEAEIADLLRNRIRGWHTTLVDFGEAIDWNTRAFGNAGQYGFHYMGWIDPAIRHYALTGDERVGAWLARTIRSAYDARLGIDPSLGAHPMYYELGARAKLINMPLAYLALVNRGGATPESSEAILKLILGCARSLLKLQQGYRQGNWQIAGCGSLILAASWFPEFKESEAWLETAVRYQREHLEKDFFADGCHGERCFGYMHMSLDAITEPFRAARRIGGFGEHDAFFRARLHKSFTWLAHVLGPGAMHPAIGDCGYGKDPVLLDIGKPFFPKNTDTWLGVDRNRSYFFKPSGFAAMRNGAGDEACYLLHTFGPSEFWHSHMDVTSLCFYAHGEPLIEEVGRFEGYDNPRSHWFRAPECHNVVTVDGAHFDATDVHWRAGQHPVWFSTPEIDFLTVYHQAYRHNDLEPQSSNITLRRTVVFVKDPGYALVFDTALSEDTRNPEFAHTQNWHSPFPFTVLGKTQARTQGSPGMLLAWAREDWLRRLETGVDYGGDETKLTGPYRERHALRARRWAEIGYDGAIGFTTVLFPFISEAPAVAVRPLDLDGSLPYRAEAFEVSLPGRTDLFVLNPERLPGLQYEGNDVVGMGLVKLGDGARITLPAK